MINFFRRIRKQLADDNKPLKYMRYAVGEIVLVVIGILIALSINNWNENRKFHRIEIGYLNGLKTEFIRNLETANKSIENNNNMKLSSEKLLKLTGENSEATTEKEIARLIYESVANTTRYIPSPGSLQDLISSGNLSSISNDTLRIQFSEWYVILQNAKRQEDDTFEHRKAIIELLIAHVPFLNILRDDGTGDVYEALSYGSNFQGDIREILSVREFENRMTLYVVTLWNANENHYNSIKLHSEQILSSIENDLNRLQQ